MAKERNISIVLRARDEASHVIEGISKNALPQLAKRIAQVATAGLSVAALEETFRRSITAALDAEKATAGLAAALRAQGATAVEALAGLKAHAEGLSRMALADDEAIQGAQKVLISVGGLLGPKLDEATKAALDLAAALGIDLTEAATMIAKAAQGAVTPFTKLGFEFKGLKTDGEKLDAVLAGVQAKFGGMAASEIATASGQIHELSEAFGELLETLGTKLIGGTAGVSAFTKVLQDLNDEATKPGTMGFWQALATHLGTMGAGAKLVAQDVARAAEAAKKLSDNMEEDRLENPAIGFKDAIAQARAELKASADWTAELERRAEAAQKAAENLAKTIAGFNARTETQTFEPVARQPLPSIATGSVPGTIDQLVSDAQRQSEFSAAVVEQRAAAIEAEAKSWEKVLDAIEAAHGGLIQYGEEIQLVAKSTNDWAVQIETAMGDAATNAALQLGDTLVDAAFGAKVAWDEALKAIVKGLVQAVVKALILKIIVTAINQATFGGGSAVAGAAGGGGIGPHVAASEGAVVPLYAAKGHPGGPKGTDTVPAWLTPGEIVIAAKDSKALRAGQIVIAAGASPAARAPGAKPIIGGVLAALPSSPAFLASGGEIQLAQPSAYRTGHPDVLSFEDPIWLAMTAEEKREYLRTHFVRPNSRGAIEIAVSSNASWGPNAIQAPVAAADGALIGPTPAISYLGSVAHAAAGIVTPRAVRFPDPMPMPASVDFSGITRSRSAPVAAPTPAREPLPAYGFSQASGARFPPGRTVNITINAVDAPGVRELFQKHADELLEALDDRRSRDF